MSAAPPTDDADVLALTGVGEAVFKFLTVGEIIFRLQNLVARKPLGLAAASGAWSSLTLRFEALHQRILPCSIRR